MSIERWPYTNLHDLNLDWILEKLKQFEEKLVSFEQHFPAFSNQNGGYWDIHYAYDPNELVIYDGAIYAARRYVPTGIAITNESYWIKVTDINPDIFDLQESIDTLEKAERFIFPEQFGAVGDGVADDTKAVQAMLDALTLPINKRKIGAFGGKVYKISAPLRYRCSCNRPLFMFGSTIVASKKITMLYLADNPDDDTELSYNSLIGPGTFNMNSLGTIAIEMNPIQDSATVKNIRITGVAGGAKGIYAPDSSRSQKIMYSDIAIWGLWNGKNLTNVGLDLQAWDAQLVNIQTYNLGLGIRSQGGITLVNHHHWVNPANYESMVEYKRTHAIDIYRGQLTNLYYDCGVGVSVASNNVVIVENIHKEVGGLEISPLFTENIMISIRNEYDPLVLNGYYWSVHTTPPKLITVENRSKAGQLLLTATQSFSNNVPLRINDTGNTIPVDASNRMLSGVYNPFGSVTGKRAPSGYYLIGYIKNNDTYANLTKLYMTILDTEYEPIKILASSEPTITSTFTTQSDAAAIALGAVETINNIDVYPVYLRAKNFAEYYTLTVKVECTGHGEFFPMRYYAPINSQIKTEAPTIIAETNIGT